MKVAVIGAGKWGINLVENFHRMGVLGAICETDAGIRTNLSQKFQNVALFTDYHEVIKGDCEVLAVATPASTHFVIAREALLAGKDVFVEKPLTLSSAEASDLVNVADRSGRILMVGHLLLFQPAVEAIARFIKEGRLGDFFFISQERLKLGRVRSVENVLWSFGVHDLAVVLHLVGSAPETIRAIGQAALQPGIEDDVYLHLGFKGGVRAQLHASWLWPEQRRELVVVGSKGMLVYRENEQKVYFHRKTIDSKLQNVDQGVELLFEGSAEPLKLELQHFLDCVKTRGKPLASGKNAIEVIRILEKAGEELSHGKR